jgi:hypothetical protein
LARFLELLLGGVGGALDGWVVGRGAARSLNGLAQFFGCSGVDFAVLLVDIFGGALDGFFNTVGVVAFNGLAQLLGLAAAAHGVACGLAFLLAVGLRLGLVGHSIGLAHGALFVVGLGLRAARGVFKRFGQFLLLLGADVLGFVGGLAR